jgi:hypothetical protein
MDAPAITPCTADGHNICLLKMVVTGNLLFNLVYSDKFKDYLKYLCPEVEPLNCQKLRSLLDKHYNQAEPLLLPGLGERTNDSLTLDTWSSTNDHE